MRWIWCLSVFGIVWSSGCSDQEAGSDPSPVPEEKVVSEPLLPSPSIEVVPDQPVVSEELSSPDIPQEPVLPQSVEPEQQTPVDEVVSGSETTEEVSDQEAGESVSMPVVDLGSGNYAKSTLLTTGDMIPSAELLDLDGMHQSIDALRAASSAMVILFWDSGTPYGSFAIKSLQQQVVHSEWEKVQVVAINRGQPIEKVREIISGLELDFPVLLDEEGSYFSQFATETVPRLYLVSSKGDILWLDVPFRGSPTIRLLQQAIQAHLQGAS